jgi:phage anti-repressor protein
MIPEFSISIADSLYNSTEEFPVDLDHAWIWLGYKEKRNALQTLKSNFEESLDFLCNCAKTPNTGGRPSDKYYLTVECFKSLGMMAGTTKGKEIRKYFLECEKIAKSRTVDKNACKSLSGKIELVARSINLIFQNVHIKPELVASIKLNAIQQIAPDEAKYLEPIRQLLIVESATTDVLLTPTQIGECLGISAVKVNKLLIETGLQIKNNQRKSRKDPDYIITDYGKEFAMVTTAIGKGDDSTMYQQLRWYESVVDVLKTQM